MQHIVLGLAVLFSIVLTKMPQRNKKIVCFIPFAILWIFAAIRYGYGNDYFSYYSSYLDINIGVYSFRKEVLFDALLRLFPSFFLFIACSSFVTIYPVSKLVNKNVATDYIPVAVFIYCFNPYLFMISLSAIRQYIAVACFVPAVYFAYKKKIIPYLLMIILAANIHNSAWTLLPIYFLANDRKIGKRTLIVVIAVVLVFLIGGNMFKSIAEKILNLLDNKNYLSHLQKDTGSSLRSVILSSLFLIYLLINIRKLDGWFAVCAKMYLIGTIISVLVYHINMLGRMQYYFDVFMVVVIPAIMKRNSNERNTAFGIINKYFLPIMLFVILVARYINFFNTPLYEPFVHYRTILGAIN